jgi:UDP-N-acetylglucosamine 2-epimerase (non-hydrolysing)
MNRGVLHGIVGARPNMMKMAALARAVKEDGTFGLQVIHTGQHYDEKMSEVFFRELGLPTPMCNLSVGSGSQGAQTAKILEGYERILLEKERPVAVLVVGDVTSTMACTLAAAKLGIPVAHIEAGLRSRDRSMPEELNRIVTDALADLLLVSEPDGLINLAREGHDQRDIRLVGNIMVDTLIRELPRARESTILKDLELIEGAYAYLTVHRPSNVDDPKILRSLLDVMAELCNDVPFIFAAHPRTRLSLEKESIKLPPTSRFRVVPPLGYRDNLRMIQSAYAVLTDSGGIQEETSFLNVPCLTLRFSTERPITVELGSSELVGNDPELIRRSWMRLRNNNWKIANGIPLWDGHAAERIVLELVRKWS